MATEKKITYEDQRLTKDQQKKIKPANQGGGPNYLGKQETVTVPKKWLSDPDHVVAELAYITPREQKILLDENIYGSLKGKPNKGTGGIMSLKGDLGGYDASPGGPNSGGGGSGGGGNRVGQVDKNKQRVQDILQGRVVTGQTAAKGPLTTRYGNTPEYVNVKQPDGTYKQTYVGSAYKSYGQPSFFQDLFSRGASGYRGIKGNPIFGNATKNFQMKDGPLGMGYYSDEEDFGEIRDKVPFGLTGIIANMLEKFKKPPVDYSNMSEFNKLQNIDGQVIDPTGLELNKGMFGFPVNTNVTNQKPPANIKGTNLNDFQIGNPGKYATADALTEANMADYQTSLVDEFTPGGIDRTNLYEDFTDNRDFISETATSPQFNTSLINEFGDNRKINMDEFADNNMQMQNYLTDQANYNPDPFGNPNMDSRVVPEEFGLVGNDTGMLVADASKNVNQQTLENIINKDMYEKNLQPAIDNQNKKNQIINNPDLLKDLGIIT